MTEESNLSGDEISALLDGFLDTESAPPQQAAEVVRPFAFGKEGARSMSALPALDRMNEKLARAVRELLEPYVRAKLKVTAEPVQIRAFEDWQAEQREFTSLNLYNFKPLKGAILLGLEPEFVSRMVDAYYGGAGLPTMHQMKREFTATEEALLCRVSDALVGVLADHWADILPVRPQLRARETNASYANLVRGDEAIAIARFDLRSGDSDATTLDILYPVAALRAVEKELALKSRAEASGRGEVWRERLEAAIGEVRVDARTVLARPSLTLGELMELKEGDIIPVSLPAQVPLIAQGHTVALGTIGEHEGRAAIKIEKIASGKAAA